MGAPHARRTKGDSAQVWAIPIYEKGKRYLCYQYNAPKGREIGSKHRHKSAIREKLALKPYAEAMESKEGVVKNEVRKHDVPCRVDQIL
eukprot:XP_001704803.1 Hypothetical protein GL50803_92034 [Giardia lamblia ATCC 50803]